MGVHGGVGGNKYCSVLYSMSPSLKRSLTYLVIFVFCVEMTVVEFAGTYS